MKTVVIYYSMLGNTDYVAKRISKKLNADLVRIYPKKEYPNKGLKKFFWGGKSALMGETPELEDYDIKLDKYDLIIFGSPVWASCYTPPIKTFVKDNNKKLKNKKIASYVCYSGSGAKSALEKLKHDLEIDNFLDELMIIDPFDRNNKEKDKSIDDFCNRLK